MWDAKPDPFEIKDITEMTGKNLNRVRVLDGSNVLMFISSFY